MFEVSLCILLLFCLKRNRKDLDSYYDTNFHLLFTDAKICATESVLNVFPVILLVKQINSQIKQSTQFTIHKTHHKKWMFTSYLVTVQASHKRFVNKAIYIKIFYQYKTS